MLKELSLIPYPAETELLDGFFQIRSESIPIYTDSFYTENVAQTCAQLSEAGLPCMPASEADSGRCIEIRRNTADGTGSSEAYALSVTESKITISSPSAAGAFYGVQTLRQLAMLYKNGIPCLRISDKPAFEWRGFLLDTSRSFYSVEFIKKIIDLSAFHKLNRFHWHLTDDQGWRFSVPEYPLLAEKGSKRWDCNMPVRPPANLQREYYTDEEITDVVAYAAERHITVVPEVELPGHVSALLAAYPQFGCTGGPYKVESCWGIFPDVLCAGNDGIFTIYDAVFRTLVRLFPGAWIHIGGDECLPGRWTSCPKCAERMRNEGLDNTAQLQSWVTEKMAAIVLAHGKIPIGWDEVLDNTEKNPLPDQVIVQSWRGTEGGKKAAEQKHSVIMSPQTTCYMNLQNYDSHEEPGRLGFITLQKAYSFSPVPENLAPEYEHSILGGEGSLWSEELASSRVAEYLLFPRFCALSECLWLPPSGKNFDRFVRCWDGHKKRLDVLHVMYYDGKFV